ncbi:hypothetical protein C8R41DRAFT_917432 [Lentinula lateritia]|uniref:DUF4203 domain-containing protein n=1 Tax=Lentinula lateritia TaxID=40482 RepID=A0ABQ8VLW4_9AGAR|nr:hypothetical protein C8R41DRAFT_917432 [Lentinula lateritia]
MGQWGLFAVAGNAGFLQWEDCSENEPLLSSRHHNGFFQSVNLDTAAVSQTSLQSNLSIPALLFKITKDSKRFGTESRMMIPTLSPAAAANDLPTDDNPHECCTTIFWPGEDFTVLFVHPKITKTNQYSSFRFTAGVLLGVGYASLRFENLGSFNLQSLTNHLDLPPFVHVCLSQIPTAIKDTTIDALNNIYQVQSLVFCLFLFLVARPEIPPSLCFVVGMLSGASLTIHGSLIHQKALDFGSFVYRSVLETTYIADTFDFLNINHQTRDINHTDSRLVASVFCVHCCTNGSLCLATPIPYLFSLTHTATSSNHRSYDDDPSTLASTSHVPFSLIMIHDSHLYMLI